MIFLPFYGKTLKSHFSLLIIVSHYSIFKVHKHFNVECGVRSAEFFIPYSSFCILHSNVVGLSGLEPPTSRLSGVRSNRLSYKPVWFSWCISSHSHCGGDEEDRTPDLLLARQALSQLSYTPIGIFRIRNSECGVRNVLPFLFPYSSFFVIQSFIKP